MNVIFYSSNRGTDICKKCWLFMVVAMKIVDSALKSESCKSNDIFKFRSFHFTVIFS